MSDSSYKSEIYEHSNVVGDYAQRGVKIATFAKPENVSRHCTIHCKHLKNKNSRQIAF